MHKQDELARPNLKGKIKKGERFHKTPHSAFQINVTLINLGHVIMLLNQNQQNQTDPLTPRKYYLLSYTPYAYSGVVRKRIHI